MTVNEALKFMILFRNEWDVNSKTKNAEALDVAIEALEKQIPKEPIYQLEHEKCPACGSFLIETYCTRCGQKIDWKE